MESLVVGSKVDGTPFPKLMISDYELVVLFELPGSGTALTDNGHWHVGEHSDSWEMSDFSDFSGTVTLRN